MYLLSPRMATIRKTIMTIPSTGEDEENLDHSHIAEENLKWYSLSGKQCGSFLKKINVWLF